MFFVFCLIALFSCYVTWLQAKEWKMILFSFEGMASCLKKNKKTKQNKTKQKEKTKKTIVKWPNGLISLKWPNGHKKAQWPTSLKWPTAYFIKNAKWPINTFI